MRGSRGAFAGDKGLDRHACSTRAADRETGNTAEGLVDCGNAREFKRSSSVKLTRGNEGGNVLFTLSINRQKKSDCKVSSYYGVRISVTEVFVCNRLCASGKHLPLAPLPL